MSLRKKIVRYTRDRQGVLKHLGAAAIANLGAGSGTTHQQKSLLDLIDWGEDEAVPQLGITETNPLTWYQSAGASVATSMTAGGVTVSDVPDDFEIFQVVPVPDNLDFVAVGVTSSIAAYQMYRFTKTVTTGEPVINGGPIGLAQIAGIYVAQGLGTAGQYIHKRVAHYRRHARVLSQRPMRYTSETVTNVMENALAEEGTLNAYLQSALHGRVPRESEPQERHGTALAEPMYRIYDTVKNRFHEALFRANRGTELLTNESSDADEQPIRASLRNIEEAGPVCDAPPNRFDRGSTIDIDTPPR